MLTHPYANTRYDEDVYNSARELKKVEIFISELETIISKT